MSAVFTAPPVLVAAKGEEKREAKKLKNNVMNAAGGILGLLAILGMLFLVKAPPFNKKFREPITSDPFPYNAKIAPSRPIPFATVHNPYFDKEGKKHRAILGVSPEKHIWDLPHPLKDPVVQQQKPSIIIEEQSVLTAEEEDDWAKIELMSESGGYEAGIDFARTNRRVPTREEYGWIKYETESGISDLDDLPKTPKNEAHRKRAAECRAIYWESYERGCQDKLREIYNSTSPAFGR